MSIRKPDHRLLAAPKAGEATKDSCDVENEEGKGQGSSALVEVVDKAVDEPEDEGEQATRPQPSRIRRSKLCLAKWCPNGIQMNLFARLN